MDHGTVRERWSRCCDTRWVLCSLRDERSVCTYLLEFVRVLEMRWWSMVWWWDIAPSSTHTLHLVPVSSSRSDQSILVHRLSPALFLIAKRAWREEKGEHRDRCVCVVDIFAKDQVPLSFLKLRSLASDRVSQDYHQSITSQPKDQQSSVRDSSLNFLFEHFVQRLLWSTHHHPVFAFSSLLFFLRPINQKGFPYQQSLV